MMHFQAWALGLLLLAGACASLNQGDSGSVRQADCPALANVDLARLHARAGENAAETDAVVARLVSANPMPADAAAAQTRIRVRVPPTGMWAQDNFVTLWRTDEGWRMARRDADYSRPPPPPAPPPPPDAPVDWRPPPEPPNPNEIVREGLILPQDGAQLDALLADPCLALEPTRFSSTVPMRRGGDWLCVPDSSYWAAEIVQPGRPPRLISLGCENNLGTSTLVRAAASARLPPEPAPEQEPRPFEAVLEIYGDYTRVSGLSISDWYYASAAPLLAPGAIWTQSVPVPDGPVSVRLDLRDCPSFSGGFNHGAPAAKLIFDGCEVQIVQE